MSVNKHLPHIFMLPEDDANSQLATGFLLEQPLPNRQIQVLPVAGGWLKVLESFRQNHLHYMQAYQNRFMILLIDFDGRDDRLVQAREAIPTHLIDRVFILGAWTEPEDLRADLRSYETIGMAMAKDCREGTESTWGHALLRHNSLEINRLHPHLQPILFPSS